MASEQSHRIAEYATDSGLGSCRHEAVPTDLASAHAIWRSHQADRAWIEWGLCWPPFTVARPRCTACRSPWPCPPALRAHALLTDAAGSRAGLGSVATARPASSDRVARGAC